MKSKTYSAKPAEITRSWYVLDAASAPLGRVASTAARYLVGKHKPTYTPHIDGGDFVIVTNTANIRVTGNKLTDKTYYRHSGYPGGLKTRTLAEQLERDPTVIITHAVKGMLPKNKLAPQQLHRLKVYTGTTHQHTAQQPKTLEVS